MENNSRGRQSLEFFQRRGIREFVSFAVKGHESSKCMNTSKNHKEKKCRPVLIKNAELTVQTHTDWKENISPVQVK